MELRQVFGIDNGDCHAGLFLLGDCIENESDLVVELDSKRRQTAGGALDLES